MVLLDSQSRKKGESKMAVRKQMKRRAKEKSEDWSGNLRWGKCPLPDQWWILMGPTWSLIVKMVCYADLANKE